jgi:tetratricopeptide (TPR) repeat protein
MRSIWLAALAFAWSPPASAQDAAPPPDFRSMTAEELQQRVSAVQTEGFRDACATKVPLADELVRRNPEHPGVRALQQHAGAFCAFEEGRDAEGLRLLKQGEQTVPSQTFDALGLYFATRLGDASEALARLRALASSGQLRNTPSDIVLAALRMIGRKGPREDLNAFAYDVATSSLFSRLETGVQDQIAYEALAHAARSPENDEADRLLSHVRSPYTVLKLLALRDYEPIWPQVERHAGDNLAPLSDDYVAWTAGRMADKPEDRDRLSEYANALLQAGRFREVVDVAQGWLGGRQFAGELAEGDGWALDTQARAYDALGQPSEADRVLDRLANMSPDEHPWVVNFVINRQARLTGQGRWQEAVAASEVARPPTDVHGTPYARMLVASYRACALHKLGRLAESADELDFVREHFADSPTAGGQAMRCAERDDEAARLLADVLADETTRNAVLEDMQDRSFSLYGTIEGILPTTRDLILARPELREAALRHVRLIPDRFVPIAHLRRLEIAGRAR